MQRVQKPNFSSPASRSNLLHLVFLKTGKKDKTDFYTKRLDLYRPVIWFPFKRRGLPGYSMSHKRYYLKEKKKANNTRSICFNFPPI